MLGFEQLADGDPVIGKDLADGWLDMFGTNAGVGWQVEILQQGITGSHGIVLGLAGAVRSCTCMAAILITIGLSRSQKGSIVAIRTYQGMTPTLGERVFVDCSAVVLGDVQLGDDSSVWPMSVVRGDMHQIRIGARSSVQDGSVLHITHAGPYNPDGYPLLIGDEVTIGHNVTLHGCTLGNRILVGMGSIVMDGAVVEDEVVIGAGSLVPPGKRLLSGYLYVGSPVKQARPLSDNERTYFSYSASNYVKLKDLHLREGYAV
jgi:carbonic anhydrase/acetyltransferase-like protein (isoleucine patch superfamily)